jgi:hypothetical protein
MLIFSDNDVEENSSNLVHGGYYKPYFELAGNQLVERGVPVPKSIRYYRTEYPLLLKSRFLTLLVAKHIAVAHPRHVSQANPTLKLIQELQTYVTSKGAHFMVGFCTEIEGAKKRAFCQATGIDYVFLLDEAHLTWTYLYRTGGHHWTPLGHEWVAVQLRNFLGNQHFVNSVFETPRSTK